MNYLDNNLHLSILSALSSNLASTSQQDDLALLNSSFSSSNNEITSNSVLYDLIDRLNDKEKVIEGFNQILTTQQSYEILAFCKYTKESPIEQELNLSTIIELIKVLPNFDVEASLGLRGQQDWTLPDQLAFELVESCLLLTELNIGDRKKTLAAIRGLKQDILNGIETNAGHRIIGHLLPILNGLRRAISQSNFHSLPTDLNSTSSTIVENKKFSNVTQAINYDWDSSTLEGRTSIANLDLYSNISNGTSLKGLSDGFVKWSILELEVIQLASVLSGRHSSIDGESSEQPGWNSLLKGKGASVDSSSMNQDTLRKTFEVSLGIWDQTLISLEDDDSDSMPMDSYSFDILQQSLKLATLSSIALGVTSPLLISILESLISEASPVTDEDLQAIAVECLQVLARGFHVPVLRNQIIKALRSFILSPCPVLEQDSDFSASKTLLTASKCYAVCIQLLHDSSLQLSAVQSLLNHFTASNEFETGSTTKPTETPSFRTISGQHSRSNAERDLISGNVAHAVSILVQEFENRELVQITVAMLLQRLENSNPTVDGAVMVEVATLAQFVNVATFGDVANALANLSIEVHSEDELSKAVLTAQTCLATSAAKRSEFRNVYLISILSTFVKKGSRSPRAGGSKQEIVKDLLDLLPIIDQYFNSTTIPSDSEVPQAIISLFRNMWYLCVLSGFLSSPLKVTEWQRGILIRIAKETPGLLKGVGNDFIETELNYNPLLKGKDYILNYDAIKSELAIALPRQSGLIHSITASQAIFLTTVLRVESLRAEAGHPSTMLSYFRIEGINASVLSPALIAIADHVNSTFIHHFGHSVTLHDIDSVVYKEVGAILLLCCDAYAQVRTISSKYLNDLISSFPSLICESTVLSTLLELLTVLRRACQAELLDEYTPVYSFKSIRMKLVLVLPDDYTVRNAILSDLHTHARKWIKSAISRAPYEMQGLLQDYIDGSSSARLDPHAAPALDDEMGKSVAVDLVRLLPASAKEASLPAWGGMKSDNSSNFAKTFSLRNFYGGGATASSQAQGQDLLTKLNNLAEQLRTHHLHAKLPELRVLLYQCAGHLVKSKKPDFDILHQIVSIPVAIFNESVVALAQEVWTWIVDARPELESRLMVEVTEAWARTIQLKKGLFSTAFNRLNPLDQETKFTPTDKSAMSNDYLIATRSLQPHSILLSFLSSRFQAFRYRDRDLVTSCHRLIMRSAVSYKSWSTHPLARELRMRLLSFGFCVLQGSRLETTFEANLRNLLYDACLSWFTTQPGWSYGSNRIQIKADLLITEELRSTIQSDSASYNSLSTTFTSASSASLPGRIALPVAASLHKNRQELLNVLLTSEIDRLRLWLNPMMDPARGAVPSSKGTVSDSTWRRIVRIAWNLNATVAVHLPERFKSPAVKAEVIRLVRSDPVRVESCPEALTFFVGEEISREIQPQLRHLLYWAPVSVIAALPFLFPKFKNDPVLLQYALRVLEHHPVEVTFFYIPQVVQALRTDLLGYAERFIFETSKISQLFCHQIIWNMKANAYRGDAGEEADPMKPALDTMVAMIVESLSGESKDFFQREFAFFDEVTSISAKLKPFIKASKLEKKAKIDEEMAKIKVDIGVYLPSNPDGVVVDIDRLSGRPLQSHAKAPFMATFKVRREHNSGNLVQNSSADESMIETEEGIEDSSKSAGFDTWQSAIFKVGDDCRQDVLALQIIAMHKNIFTSLGLDLLVTPYRVTATGPGCGVIDVIPNATSRDEMGRAKVNNLTSFFVLKYGSQEGIEFQQARINFIQSMAAYSLLCHIVQIKDRHNGNIMIDGRGCITHIDFGFLFDIGPGGVKFEPSSFKLTHEMIMLMGGRDSVGFRQFSELTVKAFLACRPYGQAVVDTSSLMMAAEFPSFKGEATMTRLKERFRLDLEENEAAAWMKGIIDNALENPRSLVYDEFQYITNSIPWTR